jgi:hypothetical protein
LKDALSKRFFSFDFLLLVSSAAADVIDEKQKKNLFYLKAINEKEI